MDHSIRIKKRIITSLTAFLLAAAVIWLRSGLFGADNIVNIEFYGITYSTSDFFVIIAAGLCGYQYGIVVFLAALAAQAIQNGGVIDGLFSLLLYFIIAVISGYFAEKRWYKSIPKTVLAALDFIFVLGGSWFIIFIELYGADNAYSGMTFWQLCLGAVPEVVLAVAFLYSFFNFVPERIKKYIGLGYLYTSDYERSDEYLQSGHSVLKRQVTVMTMSEAIILSLFAVIFSNAQLERLAQDQRARVYEQRMITLSDEQLGDISGDNDTDSGLSEDVDDDNRRLELSEEQISTLSDRFMFHSRDFIIMDIQLGLIVISVALPLGMFFNGMIVRRVVMPIKNLSNVMTDYFSEDEDKRGAMIEKLRSMKIAGRNNEIAQLNSSMQRMIDDMTKYIDTVKHEKELESELQIAQARSEAKSQFLSNMSHEIRTPINAILGMNEMILRESSESSTLEYAENIRTAGNTLLGLVNDILDFSKIEAGKMNIIPVDYDLASLLNDLVTMIQTRADAKGLELAVKVDSAVPDHLHGDEIRIKQIVTNILTNAVKYTERGSVTLSVTYEKCKPENGEEIIGLRFSVADTGIGIKPEDMEKLFSAFERIDEERNRTVEGTGLGMNITQTLLAMMGSRLEVESEYGKGSVFSFTVKQRVVSPETIGDYEETYRNTIAGRKHYKEKFTAPDAHILVTDDTRMNLTVFVSLLKKTKVKIDTAESGNECIALAAENKYDVIFLDHRMPEKDGIETLKELLADKNSPNRGTPVICLTANAVSGAKEMYLSAGFTDYLTKPVDPEKLESALLKYLPAGKVIRVSQEEDDIREEAELPEWLSGIEDLDTSEGVLRCGGSENYLETLKVYAEDAEDGALLIERLWNDRNIPDLTVKVHALKSTSRVVGAMKLGELAERLEKAGNNGDTDTISENIETLISDYRELGKALERLGVESGNDKDLPLMPLEKLNEAYDALREIAGSFDYDSVLFVMDSLNGYRIPEEERERFGKLKKAVAKPDWDMIKQVLSE